MTNVNFVIPPFLGWERYFENLPINLENVTKFVDELKTLKATDHQNGEGSERIECMSKYVCSAIIKSVLKVEPRPKYEDRIFQVDQDFVEYLLKFPSLIGKCPVHESWKLLQSLLVSNISWIIFDNKERYEEAIEVETDRKLFEYFVNLVDPNGDTNIPFPVEADCPPELERLKFFESEEPLPCYNPLSPQLPLKNRVLSIDGGGIRGLVVVQALKTLQASLEPDQTILSCFDLIAGTSTGGLIALALATGDSIESTEALYIQMKDKLFLNQKKPYDSSTYEQILKDHFGDKKLKDISGIKVMVTATYGTVQELRMKLFTNFDETSDEQVWKVARRTSAAPSYFNPMEESDSNSNRQEFYDGGLVGNNPTRAVLIRHHDLVQDGIVVSLGTGKPILENIPLPKIGDDIGDKIAMWWSGDLESFVTAFINHVTRTDGDVVEDDKRLCEIFNCRYFRLTPTLTDVIELDETDEVKIVNLMWASKAFVNKNIEYFETISKLLRPVQDGWNCTVQ